MRGVAAICLSKWRAFGNRQGVRRVLSVRWLYKPSVADALRRYTPNLIDVAAGEHANSAPLAHGESSFRDRCNDVALVFMAQFSLQYELHANLRIVDAWLPRPFRELIEQLVRGSHLEQGGRWSASNTRMPCDVADLLVPWALESILCTNAKSLRSYLSSDENAGGLFSPSARPQFLSRRIRDPAVAQDRLERQLCEHFRAAGAGQGWSERLASECAVFSLTELSVNVMLSNPATPALLSMKYTLVGNGTEAAEPAALLACLRSRAWSSFRRLRPVSRAEAGHDDDDDDEETDQDAARDEDSTLRLMTLRGYLETMSHNWQGARGREGVRRFNALLSQLDCTDPIDDECNWKAHLDDDEHANRAVVFVVATAAGQQLLGTMTLQVQVGSRGQAYIKVADVITSANDPRDNTPLRGRGVFKHMMSEPAHRVRVRVRVRGRFRGRGKVRVWVSVGPASLPNPISIPFKLSMTQHR